MADFAQILIRAKDETKGAFDSAARNMRGLEAGAAKLSGLLRTVGVGAGLSVAGLAAFAKTGIDAADSLNDMSQRLGVSVKDLASFKLAAEQSGTSLDGIGTGIARLTRSIGEAEAGNKNMAQALASLGVTARDPKEAFFQLADAVQRIQDPAQRAALLSQVLGKSYQELVPLLNQGGAALRESARQSETFAEAMARLAPEADKFNDKLAELKSNAAGFAAQLIGPVVTSLNTVFDRFQRLNALPTATFFEKLTGQVSANLPSSIANVNGKIRDLESDIARLTQNSGGADASILPLKQELARLKQLKSELRTLSLSEAMKIADEQYKKAPASAGGSIDTSAATKATRTRTASDPLAGLLASTDIVRMAEFDKQVALLNARFDGGRKNTELYTQAMAKLVETTFAGNWKQAADDAEFFRMVEQDGIKTTQEWNRNLRDLANVDMARLNDLLANTDFERLKQSQEDMVLLMRAFTEGIKDADGNLRKLSESEYLDAVNTRLGIARDKVDELDTFAKTAAENIQNSFADFLFDPFKDGLDGMLKGFGQTIQRMIADAVAADLAKYLFGDLIQGGSGSGVAGGLFRSIGNLFSFDGGGYTGGGPRTGGLDGKGGFLSVLHPNETVVDHSRGQRMGGGATIIVNVSGTNAPDVRRAAGQGAREALGMLEGARRYG